MTPLARTCRRHTNLERVVTGSQNRGHITLFQPNQASSLIVFFLHYAHVHSVQSLTFSSSLPHNDRFTSTNAAHPRPTSGSVDCALQKIRPQTPRTVGTMLSWQRNPTRRLSSTRGEQRLQQCGERQSSHHQPTSFTSFLTAPSRCHQPVHYGASVGGQLYLSSTVCSGSRPSLPRTLPRARSCAAARSTTPWPKSRLR